MTKSILKELANNEKGFMRQCSYQTPSPPPVAGFPLFRPASFCGPAGLLRGSTITEVISLLSHPVTALSKLYHSLLPLRFVRLGDLLVFAIVFLSLDIVLALRFV